MYIRIYGLLLAILLPIIAHGAPLSDDSALMPIDSAIGTVLIPYDNNADDIEVAAHVKPADSSLPMQMSGFSNLVTSGLRTVLFGRNISPELQKAPRRKTRIRRPRAHP